MEDVDTVDLEALRRTILEPASRPEHLSGRVAPDVGRHVAARAYVRDCRLHRREPNWGLFDRLAGIAPAEDDDTA